MVQIYLTFFFIFSAFNIHFLSYLWDFLWNITDTWRFGSTPALAATGKMATDLIPLFTSIGLSESKAKETLKNATVSENLRQVIEEVSIYNW